MADYIRNWDGYEIYPNRPVYNSALNVQVITDVVNEPLTLEEAKRWLMVDFDDNDVLIQELIQETREEIEQEYNVALAPKTLKVELRNELGHIALPFGPVTEIVEVSDYEGTVIPSGYELNNGILETAYSTTVFVEYETGYTTMPAKYKRLLKTRLAYNYAHRGDDKKEMGGTWLI